MSDLFLEHYGVKGMKWGVRRSKVQRMAGKDAKEFINAKQFYGEGAGTRRKLIKGKVEQRKKTVSGYSKAFDEAVSKQDMAKASDKAVSTRRRKDFTKRNKQRAGAVARSATGQMGTQAAFVAVATGGVAYLNSPAGRAKMSQTMSTVKTKSAPAQRLIKDAMRGANGKTKVSDLSDWLSKQG